jgi:hypothetical protein
MLKMKARSIGISGVGRLWFSFTTICYSGYALVALHRAVKDYKEQRENGDERDEPKTGFPSAGFDGLDIKSSDWQRSSKWPDKEGRYWWSLSLKNEMVNNDFYWLADKARGYPDKDNEDRYWFSIHHAPSNTAITGFSQEPDYDKGFPNKDNGYYYYHIQFSDAHCPSIRQWMEEKDYNYLKRIRIEDPALFKKELAELKTANPQHPAISKLEIEIIKPVQQNVKPSVGLSPLPLPPVLLAKPKLRVKALYAYQAPPGSGQLSFAADDVLSLLRDDGPWWFCSDNSGCEGHIPSNYVSKLDDEISIANPITPINPPSSSMEQLEFSRPTAKTPQSIKQFIRLCWFQDAAQRPSAKQVADTLELNIEKELAPEYAGQGNLDSGFADNFSSSSSSFKK